MDAIDGILYINLDNRTDRKASIEKEIAKIGFDDSKIHRISAVYNEQCGHLGCGISHVQAIEFAMQKNWARTIVLEDDFHFDINAQQFDALLKETEGVSWDVLLLAKGHSRFHEKKGNLRKVIGCSTTSGYIVQQHYYKTLLDNFKESVALMEKQLVRHIQSHSEPFETIGREFETIKLPKGSQVDVRIRYGTFNKGWVEKIVTAESFVAKNSFFGDDPEPGRLKYVQIYRKEKATKIPKLIHGVQAIDNHWGVLQKRDNFYIGDPVTGHQGGFRSDTF